MSKIGEDIMNHKGFEMGLHEYEVMNKTKGVLNRSGTGLKITERIQRMYYSIQRQTKLEHKEVLISLKQV